MRQRTSPDRVASGVSAVLAIGLAAVACTVGEAYDPGGGGNGDGDGSGNGGGDGDGDGDNGAFGGIDASPADLNCDPAVTAGLNSGNHNPGLTCIAGGCHDGNTADAPPWTAAGTLFSDIGGGAPVPGATVHLTDSAGLEVVLVTAQNGNFYTEDPLTFPLTVKVSKCPDTRQMSTTVAQVQATGTACNSGGCHDAANRMHLP